MPSPLDVVEQTLTNAGAPAGFRLEIRRFETYPADGEPNSWVVGFRAALPNGQSKYRDVRVPFEDAGTGGFPADPTEQEIAAEAWTRLEGPLQTWIEAAKQQAGLKGKAFEWDGNALAPVEDEPPA